MSEKNANASESGEPRRQESPLLAGLTAGEKHAVQLTRTTIDCFNGLGMMTGVSRYGVLEGRLTLCAAASRKLTEAWGKLLPKMRWPVPPKRVDEEILPYLTTGDEPLERAALKALREQPAMVIMLARALRSEEGGGKAAEETARKDLAEEWNRIADELNAVEEGSLFAANAEEGSKDAG